MRYSTVLFASLLAFVAAQEDDSNIVDDLVDGAQDIATVITDLANLPDALTSVAGDAADALPTVLNDDSDEEAEQETETETVSVTETETETDTATETVDVPEETDAGSAVAVPAFGAAIAGALAMAGLL